jgi:hypothetical protein
MVREDESEDGKRGNYSEWDESEPASTQRGEDGLMNRDDATRKLALMPERATRFGERFTGYQQRGQNYEDAARPLSTVR